MNLRRFLQLLTILLCCFAAFFVWDSQREAVVRTAEVDEPPDSREKASLEEPETAEVARKADPVVEEIGLLAPVPAPAPPAAESRRFSGILAFADGGVPPVLSLEIYAWPEADFTSTADGKNKVVIETGADGSFSTDELQPGLYRLRIRDWSSLQAPGIFQVPSENLRVALEGYLLRVRTIAEDGAPIASAWVSIDYVRDVFPVQPSPVLALSALSRADGVAWLGLSEPGVCDIRLTASSLAPDGKGIAVRGPSGIVSHTLVRRPEDTSARLRIVLRDCDPPGELITDHCFRLRQEGHTENFLRLCSEHAHDGVYPNLSAGTYTIQLVPRYGGEPAPYFEDSAPRSEPIVLIDGEETVVELCVKRGCRMSLLVESAGPLPKPAPAIEVQLVDSMGTSRKRVSFRKPERTGVTVGNIGFGEELMTERLLPQGGYEFLVTAKGYVPFRGQVTLTTGPAARVICTLQPVE